MAASQSQDVIGVDINPHSIESAQTNAKANNVEKRIIFKVSDGFEKVEGKFDLIIIDPPFRWFVPRDIYEIGTTDENYHFLNDFFLNVGKYLADNGRILLCFGSSGDIEYLRMLITKSRFKMKIIAQRDLVKENMSISYFTYKLTNK